VASRSDVLLERAAREHRRATAHRRARRLAIAERSCRRALASYTAAEGPRHPNVANALFELGQIHDAAERLASARTCYRRALVILRAAMTRPPFDPELVQLRLRTRLLLGTVERNLGHYPAAERNYRSADAEIGPRHPDRGELLNDWGVLRKYQGRYGEAAAFYRRALRLVGPRGDRKARATLHHNLGGIAHARGRYAAGEADGRRAVMLREAALGPNHVEVAADVAALAALVEGAGRLDEAAALYRRALSVFRRRLGPRHSEVGLCLSGLAWVRKKQGDLAVADQLYRRSIAILEPVFGRGHSDVGLTLANWASVLRQAGNERRARRLFERALRIFEKNLGPRHPHTRACRAKVSWRP
jgi:tetratricopeptide (TPR) repeat protein